MDAEDEEQAWEPVHPVFSIPSRGRKTDSRCIAWLSDDRIVVDWGDRSLRIWNLTNNAQEGTPMDHWGDVRGVITTKDGRIISCSDGDQRLMVWNADSHELMDGPWSTKEYGFPLCMALSHNEELLASCHEKGIVIWDMVGTMQIRHVIDSGSIDHLRYKSVKSACFSPDGKRLAVCFSPRRVLVLNAETSETILGPLNDFPREIYVVAWTAFEQIFCGCSGFGMLCLDSNTGGVIDTPWKGPQSHGFVTCLSASPDHNFLASGCRLTSEVHLWNGKEGKSVERPFKHASHVFAVAFSPSGEFVACTGGEGCVSVWRAPWWDSLQQNALLDLSAIPSEAPSNIPGEADLDFLDTTPPRPHTPLQHNSRLKPSNNPPRVQRSILSWRWWKSVPRFVYSRTHPIYTAGAPPRTFVASRDTVHSGSNPSTNQMPRHTVIVEVPLGSGENSDESSSNATPEPEVHQIGCCGLWSRGQLGAAARRKRCNVPVERPSSSTRPPDSNIAGAPTHPVTQDILELSAIVQSSDTA